MQPGTVTIPIDHLVERSRQRPPGYMQEVLAAGRRVNGVVELPAAEYARLKEKYRLQPPGLIELLTNFTGAMARWAAAGFPVAEPWLFERRLSTCQECEYWDASGMFPRCLECGCGELKLYLATVKCKKGKW